MSARKPQSVIIKGRGAQSQPGNRFHSTHNEAFDDGWGSMDEELPPLKTELHQDTSRSVLVYNDSPDVATDRSINPYRGCEQGCVYCFARPTHAWLDMSPGLDFEQHIFYKPDAAKLLREELAKPSYHCQPVALGINTDAWQPVEKRLGITRQLLEVLYEVRHPVSIVTKSALIERDLDLLEEMAALNLVRVTVSITTLDAKLARRMEPRAASPARRLKMIERLLQAGVPTGVLVAPLIPVLTDSEMEAILAAARERGAQSANYILIRLPHEVSPLFREWLAVHEPLKAEHVMKRIRDCRGGKDYDSRFGVRKVGTGIYADLYRNRFRKAWRDLGYCNGAAMDTSLFRRPSLYGQQSLF